MATAVSRIIWFAAVLLTLVLILAGALALILTTHSVGFDATPFKDRISDALSEYSGLEFWADGDVHLRIGPTLGLTTKGLHAKNPALSDARNLLDAEHAAFEVDSISLLSGRFEPTFLRLEGARVSLRRDASGGWNWQAGTQGNGADREERTFSRGFFFPDALHTVGKDVRIAYTDSRDGTKFEAVLNSADFEPTPDGLKIELDGSVDGYPLVLRGTTATFSELIKGDAPVPLDLKGNLLGLRVTAKGNLANPRTGAQVSAALRVKGKSLAGLEPWVGEAIAARGPVEASLDLKGGGKRYELADFRVAVGKGVFDGGLKLDLSARRPALDLLLGIEEVDLTPFLLPKRSDAGRPVPGSADGGTNVFTDEPLSLGWMDGFDMTAKIRLRNLITPYTSVRDIDMEAGLRDGQLSVEGKGRGEGGRAESFVFQLNSGVQPFAVSLRYKGDKLLIAPLLASTQARGMIRGEVDISADLKASGNSGNRLASSLSGNLLFLIEHANADLRQLERLTPGLTNLFGQLATPNAALAQLNCGIAAFAFQGGRTEVKVLLDSTASTVVARGDLDLGAGTLNVRVTPDAKGVNLKVAAPVVIHGSLASPDYRVEKGHLLVSLTELVSKAAVPQLLLVDVFGDAVAENPCVKIASGKIEADREGPLEAVTNPIETVVKGAGAVVKGAGTVGKEVGGAVVKGTGSVVKGVGGAVGGLLGGRRAPDDDASGQDRKQDGGSLFLDQ